MTDIVIAKRDCCDLPCLECEECGSHLMFTEPLGPGWHGATCDNDACEADLTGYVPDDD